MRPSSASSTLRPVGTRQVGEIFTIGGSAGTSQGLTPIHPRIHCAATEDTVEELTEMERIDIENFIAELASITISITSRDASPSEGAK